MKKLEFTIEINASAEKVWDVLWEDENYRNWTSTFIKGSYYKGELQEGNEILFLSPGEHGMFAVVEKMTPLKSMHFKHYGEVLDGVRQERTYDENAIEQYDLTETEVGTKLTVTINTEEEYITYFTNSFPRALNAIKEIAEK